MHQSAQPGLPAAAPERARAGDADAPTRPRTTACPPHAARAGHRRPGAEPARSRDAGRCRRPQAGPPPARAAARSHRRLAGDGVSGHHGPRRQRRPGRGDHRVQRRRPDRGRVPPRRGARSAQPRRADVPAPDRDPRAAHRLGLRRDPRHVRLRHDAAAAGPRRRPVRAAGPHRLGLSPESVARADAALRARGDRAGSQAPAAPPRRSSGTQASATRTPRSSTP